jgi:putative transcriptional regulator
MIKHHPKLDLLQGFVTGELPASLSAAIAIHNDMCPSCAKKTVQMMDAQASRSFEMPDFQQDIVNAQSAKEIANSFDFDDMIDNIVADEQAASIPVRRPKTITMGDKDYVLPQAIEFVELGNLSHLGKLSRARLQLGEGKIHTSLLHIQPGGAVPEHTHKGYELTLLLDGEFDDDKGHYVPGEFIMLDGAHTHQPRSESGCLCFTVVNEPLQFTQGLNRLFNPIGPFIY